MKCLEMFAAIAEKYDLLLGRRGPEGLPLHISRETFLQNASLRVLVMECLDMLAKILRRWKVTGARWGPGRAVGGRFTGVLRDVVRDTSRTPQLACPRVFLMKNWDELTVVVEFCL